MDVNQAAMAINLLKLMVVIPMHCDTFPAIETDPNEVEKLVSSQVRRDIVQCQNPDCYQS